MTALLVLALLALVAGRALAEKGNLTVAVKDATDPLGGGGIAPLTEDGDDGEDHDDGDDGDEGGDDGDADEEA